jgi:hypothetical protein
MRSLSYSGITSRCCSSPAYSRPGRFMRPPSSSAAQRSDSPTHAAYTRSVVAVEPLHAVDQTDHVGEGEVPAADPTAAAPHRHHVRRTCARSAMSCNVTVERCATMAHLPFSFGRRDAVDEPALMAALRRADRRRGAGRDQRRAAAGGLPSVGHPESDHHAARWRWAPARCARPARRQPQRPAGRPAAAQRRRALAHHARPRRPPADGRSDVGAVGHFRRSRPNAHG